MAYGFHALTAVRGYMNSEERRKARYQRRKAKREEAKRRRNEGHTFEAVSSFEALRRSFYIARKGVNWKASVQRYGCNVLRNAYTYSESIRSGKDIRRGFIEFDICERGKTRHIKSVHITERVAQKALCDYGLVPVIEKSLIHANGASQKNKGTEFSAQTLIRHLRSYYRKHGNSGYILLGDQKQFFDSLQHDAVRENLERWLTDKRLIGYAMQYIDSFDHGLGLGSQVCQICAVSYQNRIDHYIKEVLRCKYYQRYMDDWYIIDDSKERLKEYQEIIRKMYADLGIRMNEKKTVITKISKPFTWLQDRYFVTDTGRVIRKPSRRQITRNRRKLKKLAEMLKRGEIGYEQVRSFYASFSGSLKHKNSYQTMRNLQKLHEELFIRRWNNVPAIEQRQGDH
jgi:hypothetical protein